MRNHHLENSLRDILATQPAGLSEYQLILILQAAPYNLFDKNALAEPLSLFQCHFVLFHSLYQIRAEYLREQQYDILIQANLIQRLPYEAGKPGIAAIDKLQQYYLDWQNFSTTQADDVDLLLTQFWRKMAGLRSEPELDEIHQAYQDFGLPPDSSLDALKREYRRLLHVHHPDKGGDTTHSQHIDKQFHLLKQYLRNKP